MQEKNDYFFSLNVKNCFPHKKAPSISPHIHVPRSIAKLLIYPFCVNTHFSLIGTALLPQILVLTSLTIPLPQPSNPTARNETSPDSVHQVNQNQSRQIVRIIKLLLYYPCNILIYGMLHSHNYRVLYQQPEASLLVKLLHLAFVRGIKPREFPICRISEPIFITSCIVIGQKQFYSRPQLSNIFRYPIRLFHF